MSINCWHCKGNHETALDVKLCFVANPEGVPTFTKNVNEFFTAAADAIKALPPKNVEAIKAIYANTTPAPVIPAGKSTFIVTPVEIVKKGQDLDLGMYQVDGTVYKVKFNKAGTLKYVEKLYITQKSFWDAESGTWKKKPSGKFVYANSMIYNLTSAHKMDEAAAKAFHDATAEKYGVTYGFCCVCGKLLTVKKSIAAGIGPVCAGKL